LALKAAQDILWANLPPSNNLADEAAVQAIRNIVRSPAVKSEIKRGSDTAPTFVLRATNQIVSDQFRAPADTITLLWGVLDQPYLNKLNEALVDDLQKSGEAFVSHAVIDGRFVLRACIVNFRTSRSDVEALPAMVVAHGRRLDTKMRPNHG
jgi:hypothetical protein